METLLKKERETARNTPPRRHGPAARFVAMHSFSTAAAHDGFDLFYLPARRTEGVGFPPELHQVLYILG